MPLAPRTTTVFEAELGLHRRRVAFGTLRALMPLATRTTTVFDAELGLLRCRVVTGTR